MNSKWKDRLLSSSVPLEFEIAKILVEDGFFRDYDFTYQRLDEKEEKEFSIDIRATSFYPFDNPNKIELELDLLVECKFRMQDIKWVFLPTLDPYEKSKISLNRVVKFIDEFSEVKFPIYRDVFEINYLSSKGIEINTKNGEVHDKGIHHGANQLLFSLPTRLAQRIKISLEDHLDDVFPESLH